MAKFLPIALVLAIMVGAVLYLRFSRSGETVPAPASSLTSSPSGTLSVPADTPATEGRLKRLEDAVNALAGKPAGQTSGSLETRLKNLENVVTSLQSQVAQQGQPSGQTAAPTTTKKPTLYIPLGWTGVSSATDWTTISGQSIDLDPADYPGYTSMQFEASLKALSGNGRAYARLLNNNDGTAILSSEVSTTGYDYTWVTSSGFTLPGKKTYKLQLKSLTGYETGVQSARIKVNF